MSCVLLFAMKYVRGMHLRVSEDAETKGLDNDQFFDEQIGDWSFFHATQPTVTEGVRRGGVAISSDNSMDGEGAAAQTKRE